MMKRLLLIISLMAMLMFSVNIYSQDQPIITVAVPDYMAQRITDLMIQPFEQTHGVDVEIISASLGAFNGDLPRHPESYLEHLAEYATQADVLYFAHGTITPAATQSGYLLNLAPLDTGDPDFYAPMADAYRWDSGLWAVPMTIDPQAILYDPVAFDAVGLAYPTAQWTIQDYADAARLLTQYSDDGNISQAGFFVPNPALLLRALHGNTFTDDMMIPAQPQLEDNALITPMDSLNTLLNEGTAIRQNAGMSIPDFPLMMGQAFAVEFDQVQDYNLAPLPGDTYGLYSGSLAVSSGTVSPELAYALADFLSKGPDFVSIFGLTSARPSLVDASALPIRAEIAAMFENGLTARDLRFSNYVDYSLTTMQQENLTAAQAVSIQQRNASDLLITAAAHQDAPITVNTPIKAPVDGITLRFEFPTTISPMPGMADIQQIADLFSESDPEVGAVEIVASVQGISEEADCFYTMSVNNIDPTTLLQIDPLLDTDINFDPANMLPGVMQQVTRDGAVYGVPISIQPGLLTYNRSIFEAAGLDAPPMSWTIDELLNIVDMLRFAVPEGTPVIQPRNAGNTMYLNLIAAFGGLPFDYSTTPATLNFTDPATIAAIQQVLDLARNGTLAYAGLEDVSAGMGMSDAALSHQLLLTFGYGNAFRPDPAQFGLTTYPGGATYQPMNYSVGAGFIHAATPHAEACYRWLQTLARNAVQLDAMPTTYSAIDVIDNAENAAVFEVLAAQMADPKTVIIPARNGWGNTPNAIEQVWFNRALDAYFFDNADLATSLADAQMMIAVFRACEDTHTACAVQIDPALSSRF